MFRAAGLIAAGAIAASPGLAADPRQTASADVQGFSVQLVLAETDGSAGAFDAPSEAARRAIGALAPLLPFTSYRLLDTQWLLCCGSNSMTATGIAGRLRGVDGQEYGYTMSVTAEPAPKMPVRAPSQPVTRSAPRTLIDSVFIMGPSETAVVGTYSISRDSALGVLVTSVPKPIAR